MSTLTCHSQIIHSANVKTFIWCHLTQVLSFSFLKGIATYQKKILNYQINKNLTFFEKISSPPKSLPLQESQSDNFFSRPKKVRVRAININLKINGVVCENSKTVKGRI